jgi:hypothetical protein
LADREKNSPEEILCLNKIYLRNLFAYRCSFFN